MFWYSVDSVETLEGSWQVASDVSERIGTGGVTVQLLSFLPRLLIMGVQNYGTASEMSPFRLRTSAAGYFSSLMNYKEE